MGGMAAFNHWFDQTSPIFQFLVIIGTLIAASVVGRFLRLTWSEPGGFWIEVILGTLVIGYLFWFFDRPNLT